MSPRQLSSGNINAAMTYEESPSPASAYATDAERWALSGRSREAYQG